MGPYPPSGKAANTSGQAQPYLNAWAFAAAARRLRDNFWMLIHCLPREVMAPFACRGVSIRQMRALTPPSPAPPHAHWRAASGAIRAAIAPTIDESELRRHRMTAPLASYEPVGRSGPAAGDKASSLNQAHGEFSSPLFGIAAHGDSGQHRAQDIPARQPQGQTRTS